jgi:tRNA U34 5-carboxymethylaminomethyl modifying enzyme MnmG/GidA
MADDDVTTIPVNGTPGYDVLVGRGLLAGIADVFRRRRRSC